MSPKDKGSRAKRLPLETLRTKARPALNSTALVGIAASANSPNAAFKTAMAGAAYEVAFLETGDVKLARKQARGLAVACQYLAAIKRGYGKAAFDEFVSSVVSNRPQEPERPGKRTGEETMETKTKEVTQAEGQTAEAAKPLIPLQGVRIRAAVNGAFARVRQIQTFGNNADHPVEAVYVFPLSDEATVISCRMRIGERRVEAELKERGQARQEYEQAVAAGHHGALMEQERPNIFEMNVGGIEPGETIEVEFDYVQRIPWQDGGGRFTAPLVVAPRFVPGIPTGKTGGGWAPDTDQVPDASKVTPVVDPQGVPYNAEIQVSFAPGFRCKLSSPSHGMVVQEQTVAKDDTLQIETGAIRTDRDFILVYRSLQRTPSVAVHLGQAGDENFVLASVIPPGEVTPQASDIVLLLDGSGSMKGAKMAGLRTIVRNTLGSLTEQNLDHRVAVILFGDSQKVIAPFGPLTDELIQKAAGVQCLNQGTQLGLALTAAFGQFTAESTRPKMVLLVTDGEYLGQLDYAGRGARIVSAGIGTAVDEDVLKSLARQTGGAFERFYPGEDFTRATNSLVGMLSGPVLHDLKVEGGNDVVGVQDVFEGRPATIAMRFAQGQEVPEEIKLHGVDPAGQGQQSLIHPRKAKECDFAAQIWAREFIRETKDSQAQVPVSLQYGVICAGTSFVAVSLKEVPGQEPERIDIPVNLPQMWEFEEGWGGASGGASLCCMSSLSTSDMGHTRMGARRAMSALTGDGCDFLCAPVCPSLDDMVFAGAGDDTDFGPVEVDDVETVPTNGRFSLDADDPIDRLIGILVAADNGDHHGAQAALDSLDLTVEQVQALSEARRAMGNYVANRLATYGLNLDQKIKDALAKPPTGSNEANAWHQLTRKECGFPAEAVSPLSGWDGAEYLRWKFGQGPRTVTEPWSLVP